MGVFVIVPHVPNYSASSLTNGGCYTTLYGTSGKGRYVGTVDAVKMVAFYVNTYLYIVAQETASVALSNVNDPNYVRQYRVETAVSGYPGYFYYGESVGSGSYSRPNPDMIPFNSLNEAMELIGEQFVETYPITYRPTNCSFPGAPTEAAVGSTVVVPVAFPDGYGLVNESNIYVTNNRVAIPSTYSDGQLTFTMPNPT